VSTCLERGGPLASSEVSRFRALPPTAWRPWPKRCWISSHGRSPCLAGLAEIGHGDRRLGPAHQSPPV